MAKDNGRRRSAKPAKRSKVRRVKPLEPAPPEPQPSCGSMLDTLSHMRAIVAEADHPRASPWTKARAALVGPAAEVLASAAVALGRHNYADVYPDRQPQPTELYVHAEQSPDPAVVEVSVAVAYGELEGQDRDVLCYLLTNGRVDMEHHAAMDVAAEAVGASKRSTSGRLSNLKLIQTKRGVGTWLTPLGVQVAEFCKKSRRPRPK